MPDTHPWVVWATVIAAVITVAAATVPRVRELISPIFGFVSSREVRKIERQARIEAAAAALHDERNRLLSIQLSGVSAQLDAVLRQSREDADRYQDQLDELLRQRREDSERHQAQLDDLRERLSNTSDELAATTAQLSAAMVEIAALRAELAAYRKAPR
ncbi:hypothetical protein ACFWVM_28905 [Nocardia fluminea]|uniref:hypothetical protein n=1 Tax=Nocardia fluminea TaxID=134984 RepID=UPI003656FC38